MTEASGGRFSAAMIAAGILLCIDLDIGPRNANAGDLQFDIKTDSVALKNSFKNEVRDADGWLSLKVAGSMWNMNPPTVAPSYDPTMFEPVSLMDEPAELEWNQVPVQNSAVADTRTTLGVFGDRLRLTSRQDVSSYVVPGTGSANLMRLGLGPDNAATSQRIDATILKSGSTGLSLFGEYDRVGAYFQAPTFAIKPQDAFSTPNSTTTRFGGALQQGPITLTLEQRAQQSLAQINPPIKVENIVGLSFGFDELLGRSSWIPEYISWIVPSSSYVAVGQGSVRAALDQGVNGDTMSDVSAGFMWNRNKIFTYLGYWRSNYQSQLYPWQGLGIDGSVGYHESSWAIDFYVDVYNSITSYPTAFQAAGVQSLTSQRSDSIFGGMAFSGHF